MDTAQWPQEFGMVKPLIEEMISNTCSSRPNTMLERTKTRSQKEQAALNCPRCNSTNTKFCYYNNYSLTQPRYFCKTCRRYWTEGGSLRNVPVGGGSRKNKKSSSSVSASSSKNNSNNQLLLLDLPQPSSSSHHLQNPKIIEGQDLNLAFPIRHDYQKNISELVKVPTLENNTNNNNPSPSSTTTTTTSSLSALELLRTGMTSRGLNFFMPIPDQDTNNNNNNSVFQSEFSGLQDFKPNLSFGLDGLGSGYGGSSLHEQGNNTTSSGRLSSFPFEDLRQVSSSTSEFEQNSRGQGDNSNGYWSGMLGGGSW